MATDPNESAERDRLTATWVELTIRLGVLALLLYWTYTLIQPFISIAIWAVVLSVALYPFYERMVGWLGGRRGLAAALLTLLCMLVVIGPATWLVLGMIDSLLTLSGHIDLATLTPPPPPETVKAWPLIGEPVYQFWDLASTNLRGALAKIVPQLRPVGTILLGVAAGAGTGALVFFVAIIVAGFLYAPGPALVEALRRFVRRLTTARGEEFIQLAGATIRAVSRGVIGISVLQALLAGIGVAAAGIPGAGLIATGVLILGIIQIGPSILIIPLIVWSWFAMETTTAILFTGYMIPVNLIDNVLRPLVMGRGLETPTLIILIGVIGGTLSHGITGLFLGPIVLAVVWVLLKAWIEEREAAEPK
jgi:predicted PurR-regulated permease PerM